MSKRWSFVVSAGVPCRSPSVQSGEANAARAPGAHRVALALLLAGCLLPAGLSAARTAVAAAASDAAAATPVDPAATLSVPDRYASAAVRCVIRALRATVLSDDAETVALVDELRDVPLAESAKGAAEMPATPPGPGVVPPDVLANALRSHDSYPIVPVSVTLAQWAKESGWSRFMPANSNNPFGIKCYDAAKGCATAKTAEEDANGKQSIVNQKFQTFASADDAFMSHARILSTLGVYEAARNSSDIDGFARGLAAYATDKDYTASLIRDYLKPYDLYRYDDCTVEAG